MSPVFRHLTFAASLLALPLMSAHAGEQREPYGIGLEGYAYPYPVSLLPLVNDGEPVRMAYMDVAPAQPNGRVVVLLHGRNFPVELLGAGHQDTDRCRLSRGGA